MDMDRTGRPRGARGPTQARPAGHTVQRVAARSSAWRMQIQPPASFLHYFDAERLGPRRWAAACGRHAKALIVM